MMTNSMCFVLLGAILIFMDYGVTGADLSRRPTDVDSSDDDSDLEKRAMSLAYQYAGLGKRLEDDEADIVDKEKRFSNSDAMRYAGLGKRLSGGDAMRYAGLGKRFNGDPMRYAGLGKRMGNNFDAMKYAGLGKRLGMDTGMKFAGLGKRMFGEDTGMKYAGLGKRLRLGQADLAMKYAGIGKRVLSFDSPHSALQYTGLGKRAYIESRGVNLGMHYAGLGKRSSDTTDGRQEDSWTSDDEELSGVKLIKRDFNDNDVEADADVSDLE